MAAATRKKATSARKTTRKKSTTKKTKDETRRSEGAKAADADQDSAGRGGEMAKAFTRTVERYEQALELLHGQDYEKAGKLLEELLGEYERQDQLRDRLRVYAKVCADQLARQGRGPKTAGEKYELAVLHANDHADDEALELLDEALAKDEDSHRAHYLRAVLLARKGESEAAAAALERAIALDPEYRLIALNDPDLEDYRDESPIASLLEAKS